MMSNTLDEVIAFLDDLEARRPTREDLDKVYFPIVETIARIKDETSMETLVWRYAASPAWIIPYNLAHAVTHNEGTFSTPLLVALIEKLPTNPVHDLLHQYLAYLQVHVERNLAGLKKSLPHMREFVITAASYAGVGDGLVRMFLYELLRCVLDKGMFMEFFPPDDAVNLRRALESEEIAGSSHLPRSPVEADDYVVRARRRVDELLYLGPNEVDDYLLRAGVEADHDLLRSRDEVIARIDAELQRRANP